ncbi:hypothetical protein B0H10DRAFT_929663 [Mycena sp. CBHHK59/15]|nr:hypothetical protein B0H10DRAFT_929663 [Mycena sp. CBHHK59/15]
MLSTWNSMEYNDPFHRRFIYVACGEHRPLIQSPIQWSSSRPLRIGMLVSQAANPVAAVQKIMVFFYCARTAEQAPIVSVRGHENFECVLEDGSPALLAMSSDDFSRRHTTPDFRALLRRERLVPCTTPPKYDMERRCDLHTWGGRFVNLLSVYMTQERFVQRPRTGIRGISKRRRVLQWNAPFCCWKTPGDVHGAQRRSWQVQAGARQGRGGFR